jgi:hypothetical protein
MGTSFFGVRAVATVGLIATLGIVIGVAVAGASPSSGSVVVAGPGPINLYGHRLGIGASTARDIQRAEGGKPTSTEGLMGRMGPAGQILTYRVGKGKSACKREYGFSTNNPRLGSFESTCRDTRTSTGTKFGMSPRQVMGHQYAKYEYSPPMGHDCTFHATGVATEFGGNWLVVWLKGGKTVDTPNAVKSIALYGPNAPIWAAACS